MMHWSSWSPGDPSRAGPAFRPLWLVGGYTRYGLQALCRTAARPDELVNGREVLVELLSPKVRGLDLRGREIHSGLARLGKPTEQGRDLVGSVSKLLRRFLPSFPLLGNHHRTDSGAAMVAAG